MGFDDHLTVAQWFYRFTPGPRVVTYTHTNTHTSASSSPSPPSHPKHAFATDRICPASVDVLNITRRVAANMCFCRCPHFTRCCGFRQLDMND
jgi:hypothetical protein